MKNRSQFQKKPPDQPGRIKSVDQASQPEIQPEALQRVKDNRYPLIKSADMLNIQQSAGNKALGSLVTNRGFGVQRHSLAPGRQGVGEEEDEIQTAPEGGVLQQHSLDPGREGVGEEEDEIQSMPLQRAPAFGRVGSTPQRNCNLWGDGRSVAVQRKNGKAAEAGKGAVKADPKGGPAVKVDPKIAEEEAAKKRAEDEYKKFTAGGPYRINPYVPDQVDDFGKFESIYDPANRTLTADMRVKFTFPDLPVPKGDDIVAKVQAPLIKMIHSMYQQNFISQVHKGWSGKFSFKNVREPQSVWGKLNPINVKVNVHPVESNQHYLLKGYFKKSDTANVSSNTLDPKNNPSPSTLELFKGDLDPMTQSFTGNPTTGTDEIKRLQRNLPKIHFANSSMAIEPKYLPDLQYVADYLKQMNRPKFNITAVGHANKTGKEADNIKYSAQRAQIVMNKLKAFGATNHALSATGVGSTGATASGAWRKVDFSISVDKSFSNVQDTTVHEFGHMLGLDDEYVRKADTRTHTTQKAFMAKMLGHAEYGKGKEGKLGEEVTSVLPLSSASVMESGNEVRPYHYVTLWQALYDTAAKAASQPTPAFSWQDWKVSGF